ncbi:zinc-finger double domain-containing protein [Ditylenchus destructor]|uniref:Zinc-finger double domain-containing protein n=1 Tax=Ditylenchus destructor TaxID=166010 RepID=A0AAD4N4P8_9BILA|nr:zinc-finger double domain-containing protein [Ditylenchus destructor]
MATDQSVKDVLEGEVHKAILDQLEVLKKTLKENRDLSNEFGINASTDTLKQMDANIKQTERLLKTQQRLSDKVVRDGRMASQVTKRHEMLTKNPQYGRMQAIEYMYDIAGECEKTLVDHRETLSKLDHILKNLQDESTDSKRRITKKDLYEHIRRFDDIYSAIAAQVYIAGDEVEKVKDTFLDKRRKIYGGYASDPFEKRKDRQKIIDAFSDLRGFDAFPSQNAILSISQYMAKAPVAQSGAVFGSTLGPGGLSSGGTSLFGPTPKHPALGQAASGLGSSATPFFASNSSGSATPFGATTTQTSAFGKPMGPAFGQPQQTSFFGSTSTPAAAPLFGQTTTTSAGQQGTAFGFGGQQTQPSLQQSTSTAPSASPFGTPKSAFGTPSFGATQTSTPSLFGSTPTTMSQPQQSGALKFPGQPNQPLSFGTTSHAPNAAGTLFQVQDSGMDRWLKFYKENDVSIYHEGNVYVFYRDLDPLKPDANPELRFIQLEIGKSTNEEEDINGECLGKSGIITNPIIKIRSKSKNFTNTTRQLFFAMVSSTCFIANWTYSNLELIHSGGPLITAHITKIVCYAEVEFTPLANGRLPNVVELSNGEFSRTSITIMIQIDREKEYNAGSIGNYEAIYESTQKTMQAMNTPKIVSKRGKLRECSLCCYSSRNSNHMKQHLYTHIDERTYSCDQCPYACIKFCDLIRHERCHTGERPYECTECDYASPNSTNLKSHKLSHSGLKPYKCGFCPNAYTRNSSLKEHMRTHTGEKPYKCDLCPYAGNKKYHLKMHQLRHHQNVYGSETKKQKGKTNERKIQNGIDDKGISLPLDSTSAGSTRKNSKRVKAKKQTVDTTEPTQSFNEDISGTSAQLGPSRLSCKRIKKEKQTYICADPDTTQTDCEELSGISSLLDSPTSTPNHSERIKHKKQTDSVGRDSPQIDEEEIKSDEDILIAEKILDKRRNGHRTEYLIKFLGYEDIDDQKWVPVGMLNCTDMILEYERSRNEDVKVVDKRVKNGIAQYKVKKKNRQRHFWASTSDLEPYRDLIRKFEKTLQNKAKFCDTNIVSKSGSKHPTPTSTKRTSPFPRISGASKSKYPKMHDKSFNDVPFNISTETITKSCIPVPSYRKLAIFNKC